MLSYATILIASLIMAVAVLFLRKVISGSSKAVRSSKSRVTVTNALNSLDRSASAKRWNMGETIPAMPVDSSGSGNQVPGQPAPRQGARVRHCSMSDVNAAEPVGNTRNTGWLHREERRGSGGKVYKVKRRSARKPAKSQGLNTPWGW